MTAVARVGNINRTQITLRSAPIALGGTAIALIAVTQVTQGLSGADGSTAQGQISADANNAITPGSDDKLYAPDSFVVLARFAEIAGNETAKAQARQNLGLETIDGGTFN